MKVRRGVMIAVLVGCGVALAARNTTAGTIEDPNLFLGHTVATSSIYNGLGLSSSSLADGTTAVHIFADGNAWNHAAILGFNSGVSSLRFYDAGWGPRTPDTVKVYYSADPNPTSMDPFTYYGTYQLATQPVTGGNGFTNPSSNAADIVGSNAVLAHYAEVGGLNIPSGTQSIWFSFPGTQGGNYYGPAIAEIQGFAPAIGDANLLLGKPVSASSSYGGPFSPAFATDGTGEQHVFQDPGGDQRLVVSSIDSGFNTIRLWRDPESPRVAARALIKSSSLDLIAFDDPLWASQSTLTDLTSIAFNDAGYADITVNAPAGTESLFFDFGAGDSNGSSYGIRVVEVQAFNFAQTVPEPASVTLLAGAVLGLLAYAWRRRK